MTGSCVLERPEVLVANFFNDRTISGIIEMKWWRAQFSTGYRDPNNPEIPSISPSQSAEIVSILSAGTFFGSLCAAPFADYLGRRISLMISVGIFMLGVLLQTAASNIPVFTAGRYKLNMYCLSQ